jgi:V8-like Glu-specific endopeptidase
MAVSGAVGGTFLVLPDGDPGGDELARRQYLAHSAPAGAASLVRSVLTTIKTVEEQGLPGRSGYGGRAARGGSAKVGQPSGDPASDPTQANTDDGDALQSQPPLNNPYDVAVPTSAARPQASGSAIGAAPYSTSVYPYDAVCYITTNIAGGVQGSGAIIGPHTILTCSHLLWDSQNQTAATQVQIYPGYSDGGNPIATASWAEHYNKIDYTENDLPPSQTQSDFAIIDVAENLSSYGSFGIDTGYPGGTVHQTGYPAIDFGDQSDQVGSVTADPNYTDLDLGTIVVNPGDSGGPLWIDTGSSATPQPGAPAVAPDIVGITSSSDYAVQLTSSDVSEIEGWEQADSSLWSGPPPPPPPTSGTGVVFQNVSDGDTGYWGLSNGVSAGWFDLGGSNAAYHVVGTGNFLGTATSDILFQNTGTGDTGYWKMSNGTAAGFVDLGGSNNTYHVVATDDLLGTGSSDVLFENVNDGDVGYWNISNGVSAGFVDLGGSSAAFHVVGTGNFTGSGVQDILFQDQATGDSGYWSMNNGMPSAWVDLGGSNSAYHAVGAADFNGDGTTDILFENTVTGDTGYWEMSNGAVIGFEDLGGSNAAYQVAAIGDFAGDGSNDILFQNNQSGDAGYWRMSGGTAAAWVDLGGSNAAYHAVGAITLGA